MKQIFATAVLIMIAGLPARAQIIETMAGGGPADNTPATSATIAFPTAISQDATGNLYVASNLANRIYRIDPSGRQWIVAGNAAAGAFSGDGGPATAAFMSGPFGVAVDAAGHVFFADTSNQRVRRVDAVTGTITTIAGSGTFCSPSTGICGDGGPAISAAFAQPRGIAFDGVGDLLIVDASLHRVRKIAAGADGFVTGALDEIITTVAGNGTPCAVATAPCGDGGPATSANLNFPSKIAIHSSGNLYIGEIGNRRVRVVNTATGVITTAAGNGTFCSPATAACGDGGPATSAAIGTALGLRFDSAGNLFIATGHNRIRRVDGVTGLISTVAGTGLNGYNGDSILAAAAQFGEIQDVIFDSAGNLVIADYGNLRLRRVDASGPNAGKIFTIAGNGFLTSGENVPPAAAALYSPLEQVVAPGGDVFMIGQQDYRVRKLSAATGLVQTYAGTGVLCPATSCGDGGLALSAQLRSVTGLALDAWGNLFIADNSLNTIRRVDAVTQVITRVGGGGTLATNGIAATTAAMQPLSLAFDAFGALYVGEHSSRIRRIDPGSDGRITGAADELVTAVAGTAFTNGFAGDGGAATAARISNGPYLAFDAAGNLFIADGANRRVRRIVPGADGQLTGAADEVISTIAGTGINAFNGDGLAASATNLTNPRSLAFDSLGHLYISDPGSQRIRRADAVSGIIQPSSIVTTIAGTGTSSFSGDGGPARAARLSTPVGIFMDPAGRLLLSDFGNNRVRRIDHPGNHSPVANAGPDISVSAATSGSAPVTLNGSASSDADGHSLTYTWTGSFGTATGVSPTVNLPLGPSAINLTVNDGFGGSASDVVVVNLSNTVTTINVTPNPAVYGQPQAYNVMVASLVGGTPTGTVTITWAGFAPQTYNLTSGQLNYFTTAFMALGTTLFTARYNGAGGLAPSTATANLTVTQAQTTVNLTSSANPSTPGQSVTFTATVSPVAPATQPCCGSTLPITGSVQFFVDAAPFGAPVSINGSPSAYFAIPAILNTSALSSGSHTITAQYSGNTKYGGSTASLTQTVGALDSTPPVIVPEITGTLGMNGWYTSAVGLSWSVTDPESSITSSSGCNVSSVTADTTGTTFTCSATSAGGASTQSITLKRDATPPSAAASVSHAANAHGWYNSNVVISFSGTDATSGIAACLNAVTLMVEGAGQSTAGTCTDEAGNVSAPAEVSGINIDKTAPAIAGSTSPAANGAGWHNVPVVVSFVCSDTLSGLAAGSPPAPTALSTDGANQSASGTCSDLAGNTAGAAAGGINIDQTPPAMTFAGSSPAANSAGWNNTNVTLSWTCSDSLSGPVSASSIQLLSTEGAALAGTGQCTDLAGNSVTDVRGGVNIDKTPPTIALTTPPAGAVYLLDATVAAAYLCSDSLSSVAVCAGSAASGANVNTSTIGSKTFAVNASDLAGNSASVSHPYSVHYNFLGFLQPVDNLPVVNRANAGRTIPIKWQLKNADGSYVADLASFASLLTAPIACNAEPVDIVEEQLTSPGSTVFRYDAATNQFIFNWKTEASWRGCRLLQMTLSDGTQHWAKFEFR